MTEAPINPARYELDPCIGLHTALPDRRLTLNSVAAPAQPSLCEYQLVNVGEAVRLVVTGKWDRPAFQRVFVWKPLQVCEIADSLWRDFSLGPLLLWPDPRAEDGRSRWWIADGQHRLVSLCMLLGERPLWWRDGRAAGSGAVPNYEICFDLQASSPPYFVSPDRRVAESNRARFVPLAVLCKLDPESETGREALARLAQAALVAGCCAGASEEELSVRLGRVCRIRERHLLATIVHCGNREEVLEIFRRLTGGGLRFRRLLLQLIAARLRW
jgi:hypothetical protein